MSALTLYKNQTGVTYNKMAEQTETPSTTFYRMAQDGQLADMSTLLRICNKLHISIRNFIYRVGEEPRDLRIYHETEWQDVSFLSHRVETLRSQHNLALDQLVSVLHSYSPDAEGVGRNTVYMAIQGKVTGVKVIIEMLNAFCLTPDYFFDDKQYDTEAEPCADGRILIDRTHYDSLKERIRSLESENRELYVRLARAQREASASSLGPIVTPQEVNARTRKLINAAEKALSSLRALIEEPTTHDV